MATATGTRGVVAINPLNGDLPTASFQMGPLGKARRKACERRVEGNLEPALGLEPRTC